MKRSFIKFFTHIWPRSLSTAAGAAAGAAAAGAAAGAAAAGATAAAGAGRKDFNLLTV